MHSVQEIKIAISRLPKEDFWLLAEWFDREKNNAWDEQIQAEVERLDFLFEGAAATRQAR
jgi:hypothetical protein